MDRHSSDLTEDERAEALGGLEDAAMARMARTNKKRAATEDVQYYEEYLEFDDDELAAFQTYESYADYENRMGDKEDQTDEDYQPPRSKKTTPSPALSTASSTSSKTMKKKDREYAMKVAVCAEVRKHPMLYQIVHRNYSNKAAKDAIWEKISASLMKTFGPQMTVKMCQKLWDALRESTR